MACRQCRGIKRFFDDGTADRELRRYRRKGPARSTRILLQALEKDGVEGRTFLDVGGGVGAIQHELLALGADSGVHADASPAYLESARSKARRRAHGLEKRVHRELFFWQVLVFFRPAAAGAHPPS